MNVGLCMKYQAWCQVHSWCSVNVITSLCALWGFSLPICNTTVCTYVAEPFSAAMVGVALDWPSREVDSVSGLSLLAR